MEKVEKIQDTNSIDDISLLDYDTTQILKDLVINKLEKVGQDLTSKYFYSLKVKKTPSRTDYHTFSFERMSEISRKLINGQSTIGGITNRLFWSKYFTGGFRIMEVSQYSSESEFPSFNLIFIVYSDVDNLDIKITNNLQIRLRSIDPTLKFSLDFIGKYDKELISNEIPQYYYSEYPHSLITKLGKETINKIYNLEFQIPKYFGKLYKSK